jgi:hypothetical protein
VTVSSKPLEIILQTSSDGLRTLVIGHLAESSAIQPHGTGLCDVTKAILGGV